MRREAEFIGPDGKPEGGIVVKGRGETLVRFHDLPKIPGAWKLVHTVPQKLFVREYPFKFTDVRLPEARERARPAPRRVIRPMKP